MQHASPLPDFLVARYRAWRREQSPDDLAKLEDLAEHGQHPRAMIIACCDSRVQASAVFGGGAGEYFVHRNIANLVPPFEPDGAARATSATIEYAVGTLGVAHLIVMGHSGCGGVAACHALLSEGAEAPGAPVAGGFVAAWLTLLGSAYARVARRGLSSDAALAALERESVVLSLENLMTFPFVAAAVIAGRLELHGVWKDIAHGRLEVYDPRCGEFTPIEI